MEQRRFSHTCFLFVIDQNCFCRVFGNRQWESACTKNTFITQNYNTLHRRGGWIMSFDVLNNPLNERQWKTESVVQQSSYGQPQTWSVLRELTTYEVTYLSGSLFVEGGMFQPDSYATACYFGQPGRLLSANNWMEKRKKKKRLLLFFCIFSVFEPALQQLLHEALFLSILLQQH